MPLETASAIEWQHKIQLLAGRVAFFENQFTQTICRGFIVAGHSNGASVMLAHHGSPSFKSSAIGGINGDGWRVVTENGHHGWATELNRLHLEESQAVINVLKQEWINKVGYYPTPLPPPPSVEEQEMQTKAKAAKLAKLKPPKVTRKYTYVKFVGIELEGGWTIGKVPTGMGSDGSVHGVEGRVGELPSPKLRPREVPGWIIANHPTSVNRTCGMHVHISVKKAAMYDKLIDPRLTEFILKRLEEWGKKAPIKNKNFWSRIRGENSFCKKVFAPEGQINNPGKSGDRYTVINYTWRRFGTIECRVLPAFQTPIISAKAVLQVVDAIEDFLAEKMTSPEKDVAPTFMVKNTKSSGRKVFQLQSNLHDSLVVKKKDGKLLIYRVLGSGY